MNFVAELPRQAFAGFNLESVPVRVTLAVGMVIGAELLSLIRVVAYRIFLAIVNPKDKEPTAGNAVRNIVVIVGSLAAIAVALGLIGVQVYAVAFAFFGHRMV